MRVSFPPLLLGAMALLVVPVAAKAQDEVWTVARLPVELNAPDPEAPYWSGVPVRKVSLVAQPMVRPRPRATTTPELLVQLAHDGERLAVRLEWFDPQPDSGGRVGQYSDAVAIQFPMRPADFPPPIFMGTREQPVHILHWRAQYQQDAEHGKPTIHELYPNMSIDMYPLEFRDPGLVNPDVTAREQYSPGRAVGNPQAYVKTGVDEIVAEGFSTSSVQESLAWGRGVWKDGRWQVVLIRPLLREGLSEIRPGARSYLAFAVWEGGSHEVGARKSVTMIWSPIELAGSAEMEVASQ